ncbi:MAG TPA: glycosyltransferase family 4 protein [Pseudonocardia sp.]|nr:glycosyltransferase family 4 protein [Pseudonocardia sp.]
MNPSGRRVLVVHSYYSSATPSGENAMVDAEVAALRRAGHDVGLVARHTDTLARSRAHPLRAAAATATGFGPGALAEAADHDLVHVHNLFPNFGRRWLAHLRVPFVVTLHNYRPLCAAASLYRDGRVCTDCLGGPLPGLAHGCYRGSRAATLPLTVGRRGVRREVLDRAARLIVLSPTQRELYARAGIPAERLVEVPNFVPDALDPGAGPGGEGWVFAGRLDEQKGADALVAAWPADIPLTVVGGGRSEREVRELARGKQITLAGHLPREEVVALLRAARGLVFPSRWPDPFGLVYAEALAAGTPVLATEPAAAAGFVRRDGTGTAVARLTEAAVREAHERFPGLRVRSRAVFEQRYTERAHVAALDRVYAEAVAAPRTRAVDGGRRPDRAPGAQPHDPGSTP